MKTRLAKTQKALLFVAGALLILVSSFILASPADFYASNNIEPGANVNLLNELKAPAGLLLAAGLFMIGVQFACCALEIAQPPARRVRMRAMVFSSSFAARLRTSVVGIRKPTST